LRSNIQAYENAILIGKVPENLLDRFGKTPDQSRQGKDLVTGRQLWVLEEINHLNRIPAL
jgi:hypothetical protein